MKSKVFILITKSCDKLLISDLSLNCEAQNKDTKTYWNRRLEGSKMGKTLVPNYTREIAMEHNSLRSKNVEPDLDRVLVPSGCSLQSQEPFAFSILSFGSETMF